MTAGGQAAAFPKPSFVSGEDDASPSDELHQSDRPPVSGSTGFGSFAPCD
jgi:hypothetical protein